VIDVESVPASTEFLESRMPEEIRNPQMPENLLNPPSVDYSACPKYVNIKDETERQRKQGEWCSERKEKHERSVQDARQKWQLSAMEARTRFVQNAALDAKLGHVKLIGAKDLWAGVTNVYVWEPDPKQIARIRAWVNSDKFPEGVNIRPFMTEDKMLKEFFEDFAHVMSRTSDTLDLRRDEMQCVTYCGNSFDFPFMYRRSWILGCPQAPMFRRGRYWDETRMVDLRDIWTFGSREEKDRSGGLDNMTAALGYERAKIHDGANFHRIYEEDPTEGITYNLLDLEQTTFAARKMGIIR
jgi:hypothetical protein